MSLWDDIVDFFYALFGFRRVTAVSALKSDGGTPVGGAPVTLYYLGSGTDFIQDGTGTTNASGTATQVIHLRRGTYLFKVVFPGKGGYLSSEAEVTATV